MASAESHSWISWMLNHLACGQRTNHQVGSHETWWSAVSRIPSMRSTSTKIWCLLCLCSTVWLSLTVPQQYKEYPAPKSWTSERSPKLCFGCSKLWLVPGPCRLTPTHTDSHRLPYKFSGFRICSILWEDLSYIIIIHHHMKFETWFRNVLKKHQSHSKKHRWGALRANRPRPLQHKQFDLQPPVASVPWPGGKSHRQGRNEG